MPVLSPVKMEKVSLTEVGSADVVCRGLGGWRYLEKASEGAFGTNGQSNSQWPVAFWVTMATQHLILIVCFKIA